MLVNANGKNAKEFDVSAFKSSLMEPSANEVGTSPMTQEERQVKRLLLDAINCTQSDDFYRYFDLFTPDAVWMMPAKRYDVSLTEAKQFYRFTEKFRFEQHVTIDEVEIFKGRGFARLTFDGYLVAKRDQTARPIRSVSRHLWLFALGLDGQWLLTRDIWNNPSAIEVHGRESHLG